MARKLRPLAVMGPTDLAPDLATDLEQALALGVDSLTVEDIVGIFDALRAVGIKPHPWATLAGGRPDALQDRHLAQRILVALQRLSDERDPAAEEQNLDPSRVFGVLNTQVYSDEPDETPEDPAERSPEQYGWAWDVAVDLSLMGAGFVRHPHIPDLAWHYLDHSCSEDGDLFPAPADMMDAVSEQGWARMARFTLYTIICYLTEQQMMGILFSYGPEAAPEPLLAAAVDEEVDYSSVTVMGALSTGGGEHQDNRTFLHWEEFTAQLGRAKPDWQAGILFVSARGWDSFYWDHGFAGRVSYADWEQGRYYPQGSDGLQCVFFERFCLHFWDGDDDSDDAGAYQNECARRKSLGAAAYGEAIGTFLQQLDAFWRSFDSDIGLADLVPTLEVGNEWESRWYEYSGDSIDDPADIPVNDGRFGELARLMVMVTAPIRHLCSDIPFTYRFPDLVGWASSGTDDWSKRCTWVQRVMSQGMVQECGRLERFQLYTAYPSLYYPPVYASYDQFDAWSETCEEAGYRWPDPGNGSGMVDFDASYLVQEAGFHFFHATTSDDRYVDESRMAQDVEVWRERVVDHADVLAHFGAIAWSISGIQFQALAPDIAEDGNDSSFGAFYQNDNLTYQAGMLVRRLLFARALGSARVLWHTYIANIGDKHGGEGADWGQFTANGLRNDLYDSRAVATSPYPLQYSNFSMNASAWRRPSWFAYRRLLWLVDAADSITIVHAEDGVFLLKLRAQAGFGDPAGEAITRRFSVAWVAWLDETVGWEVGSFSVQLSSRGTVNPGGVASFRALGLAPAQVSTMVIQDGAEGDWPQGDDALDWDGDGFGQTGSHAVAGGSGITLTVRRASPDNPAPLCILTDLECASEPAMRGPYFTTGGQLSTVSDLMGV